MIELLDRVLGTVGIEQEVLEQSFPLQRVVAYPYSSNIDLIDGEPTPYLSVPSRASIDAAAIVWKAYPESKVVLIGETCYGDEYPNTTDLMIARGREQGIDIDAFETPKLPGDKPLNNTYSQTEALARYTAMLPEQSEGMLVMPLGYHIRRAARVVRAYRQLRGASFTTAESVFREEDDHRYDAWLPYTAELHRRDLKFELVNLLDRKGRVLNLAAKIMNAQARVVDVVHDGDSGLMLEDDFALPKLERLRAESERQAGMLYETS